MFKRLLLPLHMQYDSGLSSLASAFKDTANRVLENESKVALNGYIPLCYLYRHAIELHLKSAIFTLHRRFKIPLGSNQDSEIPLIQDGDKWLPISSIHSIKVLYDHSNKAIDCLKKDLEKFCQTDWTNRPKDLDAYIQEIERMDRKSTFFRYPSSKEPSSDKWKSASKKITQDAIANRMLTKHNNNPLFTLILENKDREFVDAYNIETTEHEAFLKILQQAELLLSGLSAGLLYELDSE